MNVNKTSIYNNPNCCNNNVCECPICLQTIPLMQLNCNHYICRKEIMQLKLNTYIYIVKPKKDEKTLSFHCKNCNLVIISTIWNSKNVSHMGI